MGFKKNKKRQSATQNPGDALILRLPMDIIRMVTEHLTPDGVVALALSCRALLGTLHGGSRSFKDMFPKAMESTCKGSSDRAALSYLLRALERDRHDPSVYVCYRCLKFHVYQDTLPSLPSVRRMPRQDKYLVFQVGFPTCQSSYIDGLREVYAGLNQPRDRVLPRAWSGSISIPVPIKYELASGLSGNDMFLLRKFRVKNRDFMDSNLEICPHVYFSPECGKVPGTICEAYNEHLYKEWKDRDLAVSRGHEWRPDPFTGFLCKDCRLEVDIRLRTEEVWITVWQHLGVLKDRQENSRSERFTQKLRALCKPDGSFEKKIIGKGKELEAGDLREIWENIPNKDKGVAFGFDQ